MKFLNKKLIYSLFLFLYFSAQESSTALDAQQTERSLAVFLSSVSGVTSTIKDIYAREAELRNTISYKGVATTGAIIKGFIEYQPSGLMRQILGATYNLAKYNSPGFIIDILCKTSQYLPEWLEPGLNNLFSDLLLIYHVEDLCARPLQHFFGYVFGLTGAFLANYYMHNYTHINDDFLRREICGSIYGCLRTVGWDTPELYSKNIDSLREKFPFLTFLGAPVSAGNALFQQCPLPTENQCSIDVACYEPTIGELMLQDLEFWNKVFFYKSIQITEHTTRQLWRYLDEAYGNATLKNQDLKIVLGETHGNLWCHGVQKAVLDWINHAVKKEERLSFRINIELGPYDGKEALDIVRQDHGYMRACQILLKMADLLASCESDSMNPNCAQINTCKMLEYTFKRNAIVSVMLHAVNMGFYSIENLEQTFDESKEFVVMPSWQHKRSLLTEAVKREIWDCPSFDKRDRAMANNIQKSGHSFNVAGFSHLSNMESFLDLRKNTFLFLSCVALPTDEEVRKKIEEAHAHYDQDLLAFVAPEHQEECRNSWVSHRKSGYKMLSQNLYTILPEDKKV